MNEDDDPRNHLPVPPHLRHPPRVELTFISLAWMHRLADAVGSESFAENRKRALHYLAHAESRVSTPAERIVVEGLYFTLELLVEEDKRVRSLVAAACAQMQVSDMVKMNELD